MPTTSRRLGLTGLMPVEQRRTLRRQLTSVQVHKILSGDENWRYHYCIAYAIEHGEIWAPWIGSEMSFLPSADGDVACFWPHEGLGVRASRDYKTPVTIDPIPLDVWIDTYLDTEFRRDNLMAMLCPTSKHGTARSVDEILGDIERYFGDREAYWTEHFSSDNFELVSHTGGPVGRLPG